MKKLAEITIRRIMGRHQFICQKMGDTIHFYHIRTAAGGLVVSFPAKGLVKASARWKKGSNVHIDSYFCWPSTMADLDHIITRIKEIYQDLCGTRWEES